MVREKDRASELGRQATRYAVPTEQISLFLGHPPNGAAATTSIHAPYEPGFLADAVEAIESAMTEIRTYPRRARIDRPEIDPAELVETTGGPRRYGIGETKRQEVRWLIPSGVPHAEVVRRSGVSSGTVSAIRQEPRASMPLYRNTESESCVPIACPLDEEKDPGRPQVFERIGSDARRGPTKAAKPGRMAMFPTDARLC